MHIDNTMHIEPRVSAPTRLSSAAFDPQGFAPWIKRSSFGVKRNMDIIMAKSDWDYRGLAAECYDLWFGDEPFWDQAFFHDRIRHHGLNLG